MAVLDIRYKAEMERVEVDGKRHYVTPSGVYPSMTTILSKYKKEGLDKWRDRVGSKEANRIMNQASTQGTAVHALCEAHILGQPRPKVNPFELARFRSLERIIDNRIGRVYAIEAHLYSDYLKVAGAVDLVGEFDGDNAIIDFKTSRTLKKEEWIHTYFMQEAGYAAMWAERMRDPTLMPKKLVTLISVEHEPAQVFIQPVGPWLNKLKEFLLENHLAFSLENKNV